MSSNAFVFFLKAIQTFALIASVDCTYFRGGTISWTADVDKSVTFHSRMGFEYGANGCHNNNSGSLVTKLQKEKWNCTTGCSGIVVVGDNSYFCTATDSTENWEQGENWFTQNMSTYANQLTISYQGGMWLPLGYGPGGQWNIETTLDLRMRSDTGSPNNSPVTASIPVYRFPQGCTSSSSIPVYDKDDDVVECRWATVAECGDACNSTSSLPGATINAMTCSLTIDTSVSNGYTIGSYYLVALTIEDFPSSALSLDGVAVPSTQPLSSVPLQFLVYIDNMTASCSDKPTFINTLADGANIIVPSGTTWKQRIYLESTSGKLPLSLTTSGPRGTKVTELLSDDLGRPNVVYADITWTASPGTNGINIICFQANDNSSVYSDQRCFTLLAGYPDPCASNPCQNNGTCNISLTSYACTCPSGIVGSNCETDIDECLLSPCENRGECYNSIGDYKCFCRPGFGGKNCSGADYCSSHPCKGHGTCSHNVTTFACDCHTGYSGATCQTDIDDCLSSPCQNGAECTDLVGGYYCECPPKYTGRHCETEIDFCDPDPCQNGGICSRLYDGYICDCPDNVIGLTCEIPIEQVCDGDESFCSCFVNGEPIRVTIPDPIIDDSYERDLRAGVIGYPIGLLVGVGLCALFHYLIRPRCLKGRWPSSQSRPSSSASSRIFMSSTSTIHPGKIVTTYPDRISPPPSYSSLQKRPDIRV